MAEPVKQTIASRLVGAMGEIDAVTKEGQNAMQNYRYVRAADVANEVRKVLVKHGIAFGFDVVEEERWAHDRFNKEGAVVGVMNYVRIVADVIFEDSVTGDVRVRKGRGWGQDVGEKAIYKAMTGALKYALRMNFIIPDESDPENEERVTPASVTPQARVEAIKAEVKGPERADDLVKCFVKGITEKKTTGKNQLYLAVTWRGFLDGFTYASCFHASLFEALRDAVGYEAELRIKEKRSDDGKSIQYFHIEDVISVNGIQYKDGKPNELITQLVGSLKNEDRN